MQLTGKDVLHELERALHHAGSSVQGCSDEDDAQRTSEHVVHAPWSLWRTGACTIAEFNVCESWRSLNIYDEFNPLNFEGNSIGRLSYGTTLRNCGVQEADMVSALRQ